MDTFVLSIVKKGGITDSEMNPAFVDEGDLCKSEVTTADSCAVGSPLLSTCGIFKTRASALETIVTDLAPKQLKTVKLLLQSLCISQLS